MIKILKILKLMVDELRWTRPIVVLFVIFLIISLFSVKCALTTVFAILVLVGMLLSVLLFVGLCAWIFEDKKEDTIGDIIKGIKKLINNIKSTIEKIKELD